MPATPTPPAPTPPASGHTWTCPTCGYTHTYASTALADAHHPRQSCTRHHQQTPARAGRLQPAADRPTRDCEHPGHPHQHGTRVAYVKDRCRCTDCTAANTAASRLIVKAETFGRWAPYVDAQPVRDHIALLRSAGIGYDRIASLAGTSSSHIREIAGTAPRSGNRPAIQRIRPELAHRIMAITASTANCSPHSQLDATGTRRRLQALVAAGWSIDLLAQHLGRTPANLQRTLSGATVTARTAVLIDQLHARLWDVRPPLATDADRASTAAARAEAARNGWLPTLAWDDIDTDPEPQPHARPRSSTADDLDDIAIERAVTGDGIGLNDLTAAEQAIVVQRLTERGRSIRDIAEQLRTTKRTVSRRREAAANAA